MHRVIISGGPSTGKSTTFELLKTTYPEAHFVDEAAEQVIKRELAKQANDPNYDPALPVLNYDRFEPLVVAQQLKAEAQIPDESDLVFLDRSLIDNLGYLAHNHLEGRIPEVERHAQAARYTIAFFCDWLDKFERTEIRQETAEEGFIIHGHLEAAYHNSSVPVVHLPPVSVEERLTIIRDTLEI
jgi:predicted ATPase